MVEVADLIEEAIAATLGDGLRTGDIKTEGANIVSTAEMGDAVLASMERLAA